MCVHEFIHAICYYTHDLNIENEIYANSLFNETMTDIITAALNPNLKAGIKSSYSNYYNFVYPYINLFGETAIEAYFYGYDEIYKQIGEDEFNFFILVTNNLDKEYAEVYYNNMIFKWYAASML